MRRSVILCAALLGLLLAACGPASTPTATSQPQPTAAKDQPAAAPPTAESAVKPTEPTKPAATPDIEKVVKAQPDDHKLGPDGAPVTIIEWGDFQ